MKTLVDARLDEEAARFKLRHTCDHCVHFDGERCSHGYPTAPHRVQITPAAWMAFCKEFELE